MARKKSGLTPMQLACIKAVRHLSVDHKFIQTGYIGDILPDDIVRAWNPESDSPTDHIRDLLTANGLGPILAALARTGYLVRIPNPKPSGAGTSSFWSLGPLSDKLIEDGILS